MPAAKKKHFRKWFFYAFLALASTPVVILLALGILISTKGLPLKPFATRLLPYPILPNVSASMEDGLIIYDSDAEALIITLENINLIAEGQASNPFDLSSIKIEISAANLLDKRLIPSQITIQSPHIHLIRETDGTFSWIPLPAKDKSEAEKTFSLEDLNIPEFFLPADGDSLHIHIIEPSLGFDDPALPDRITLSNIDTQIKRQESRLELIQNLVWPGMKYPVEFNVFASWDMESHQVKFSSGFTTIYASEIIPFLPPNLIPGTIEGGFSGSLSATGNIQSMRMDEISIIGHSTDITLNFPEIFAEPQIIKSIQISGSILDDFATGGLNPFDIEFGPIRFHCEGLLTEKGIGSLSLNTLASLDPVNLKELTEILSEGLRRKIPLSPDTLQEIAFSIPHIELNGRTLFKGFSLSPDGLRFSLDNRIHIKDEELQNKINASYNFTEKEVVARFETPAFSPIIFDLKGTEDLPIKAIDIPMAISGETIFRLPQNLKKLAWDFKTQPGYIYPHPFFENYLEKPLPIQEIHLSGSIQDNFKEISIRDASLKLKDDISAQARNISLSLSQSPLTSGNFSMDLKGDIELEGWTGKALEPQLSQALKDLIPLSTKDIELIGMESFETEFDATLLFEDYKPRKISKAQSEGQIQSYICNGHFPVHFTANLDGASQKASALIEMKDWNPKHINLEYLSFLPIPLSGIDLPADIKISTSCIIPENFPAVLPQNLPSPQIDVSVKNGSLSAPNFLAKDLQLPQLDISAQINPGTEEILLKTLYAKTDGPNFNIKNGRVQNGEKILAAADINTQELNIPWLLEFWPKSILPEYRAQVLSGNPQGNLKNLSLTFNIETNPANPQPQDLKTLEWDTTLENLRYAFAPDTNLDISSIQSQGNINKSTFKVTQIEFPGLSIAPILTVSNILSSSPSLSIQAKSNIDIAELVDAAQKLDFPVIKELPWDVLKKAQGQLRLETQNSYTADFDLLKSLNPEDINTLLAATENLKSQTTLSLKETGCNQSLGAANILPANGQIQIQIENNEINTQADINFPGIEYAPYVKGSSGLKVQLQANGIESLHSNVQLNLKEMQIDIPEIEYQKPAGENANIQSFIDIDPDLNLEKHIINFSNTLTNLLLPNINLRGELVWGNPEKDPLFGFKSCVIKEAKLGHTICESAFYYEPSEKLISVNIEGPLFDVPQLTNIAIPAILKQLDQAPEEGLPTVAVIAKKKPSNPILKDLETIDSHLHFEKVQLGNEQYISGFNIDTILKDLKPYQLKISGKEGDEHPIILDLYPPHAEGNQPIALEMGNISQWISLAFAPMQTIEIPETALGKNLKIMRSTVPNFFRYGRLYLKGELNLENEKELFHGGVNIDGLVLHEAPWILKAIATALRSRVEEGILFKEFDIPEISLGKSRVTLKKFFMDGPINLSLNEVRYGFEDQSIYIDHNIILVDGTIEDPKVYLKEDVANKMVITEELGDEYDW